MHSPLQINFSSITCGGVGAIYSWWLSSPSFSTCTTSLRSPMTPMTRPTATKEAEVKGDQKYLIKLSSVERWKDIFHYPNLASFCTSRESGCWSSGSILYLAPTALKMDPIYNNLSIGCNIFGGKYKLLESKLEANDHAYCLTILLEKVLSRWLCLLFSVAGLSAS